MSPAGNPHRHSERRDYSNVEVSDNRVVIEDDLYEEPPYEDLQAIQLVSHIHSKPASKRRYENVDADGQVVMQKPCPRPPPRRSEKSERSPQRREVPEQQKHSGAKREQVENVPEGVEKLYDRPRLAVHSKSSDYDIPRRSQSPAAVSDTSGYSVPSVKSALLQSDRDVSPRQGDDSHSESHYDVPPSSDIPEEEFGRFNKERVGDRVYDVPPSTKPKPSLPKPYKRRPDQVSQSVHERKGKDRPKKPPRRAVSEDRHLKPASDLDPLYAEPLDSLVTGRTGSSYDRLDGSGSQEEKSPYDHLGSESPHEKRAQYDRLLSSSSPAPSSPVVRSAPDQYSHLESRDMRNLDEKEKLRRLREERLRRHKYEDVDRAFDGEIEQSHNQVLHWDGLSHSFLR